MRLPSFYVACVEADPFGAILPVAFLAAVLALIPVAFKHLKTPVQNLTRQKVTLLVLADPTFPRMMVLANLGRLLTPVAARHLALALFGELEAHALFAALSADTFTRIHALL
jgi:hypothetical protein